MMFVETDFLLALAKDDDWLQERAVAAVEEYETLETSLVALAEFLAVSDRYEFDRTRAMADLLDIVTVTEEEKQIALKAAKYQDEGGATAFDAVHAATVETKRLGILASDHIYDDLDIDRVALEPPEDKRP
ncbi:PIN domain-containing protein [Haladaptatus salinisoli]|uniref:PIN domain-containing protein n=1 Tax=Haladaptatus salinisoli TaxID=2884876 RepID=UPI001D0AA7A3|nr:PIN domain-containing protein [Haladaptatus salinisoli]